MVKHTQVICRLMPTNCLSVFDHFVGLALKGLKTRSVLVKIPCRESRDSKSLGLNTFDIIAISLG